MAPVCIWLLHFQIQIPVNSLGKAEAGSPSATHVGDLVKLLGPGFGLIQQPWLTQLSAGVNQQIQDRSLSLSPCNYFKISKQILKNRQNMKYMVWS